MSEHKEKKMKYGFYGNVRTHDRMRDLVQGAQILRTYWNGLSCDRGWLLGESDDFEESGKYDIVIPDEGIDSVHWDHLHACWPNGDKKEETR